MKAPIGGGGDFERTPAGNHIARAYSLVDIGEQDGDYGVKHQIIITFELVNEKMADGRPFAISKFYTLSLNEKANLCKDIESMFGKKMPDDAKLDFDFNKILNHACMVNVVATKKADGKDGEKIDGITPLPKGMAAPELANDIIFFDLDSPDWDVYENSIPDWQKKKINRDPIKKEEPTPAPTAPSEPDDDLEEDEVPF